jgi:membrane protein DedA with SNARE-associated domain
VLSQLLAQWVGSLGPAAGIVGFYLRSSGLPIPVAEHALPVYLGHHYASSPPALVAAWLGLIALAVAGSSNLYLLGRWWGPGWANGVMGRLLRLDEARLARLEVWYGRWGWATVMVASHIPFVRVPVLISAGALRMRYPMFAVSIAVTMAPRLALLLWVGVSFGNQIADFLTQHPSVYVAASVAVALFLIAAAWRMWSARPGWSAG